MTFYALSSGPGLSGVAVIRVSGSETEALLNISQILVYQNLKRQL